MFIRKSMLVGLSINMDKRQMSLALLPVLLLFFAVFASAQDLTVFAGKVYNSSNGGVDSANITVDCDSNIETTLSKEDGTYAVAFNSNLCKENNTDVQIDVSCSNSSKCKYATVVNSSLGALVVISISGGGGGRGSSLFLCGNGYCNLGETVNTCPEDCIVVQASPEVNETANATNPETTPGITGGVIGVIESPLGIAIIVFILIIGGVATVMIINRKKE